MFAVSKAPAVDYALKIIEFLARSNGEVGISDICNGLNINKNATSRVLDALMEQKWIYLSNVGQKKYRLTMKPFSVISKSIEKNKRSCKVCAACWADSPDGCAVR